MYLIAKKDLKDIFSKVRLGEYEEPQHLLLAFKKWETDYSVPFDILRLNQNEQLLYLGYILKENQLKSQKLTQALKKNAQCLMTQATSIALENICNLTTFSALYDIKDYADYIQGTSPIKSLNARFSSNRYNQISLMTYETAQIYIGCIVLKHNMPSKYAYLIYVYNVLTFRDVDYFKQMNLYCYYYNDNIFPLSYTYNDMKTLGFTWRKDTF